MVLPEIRHALERRFKRPAFRWAVLAFYLSYLIGFMPVYLKVNHSLGQWMDTFLSPLLLYSTFAWISPIPWQWDGHYQSEPRFFRGLIQSILFLGSIVFVEICISSLYFKIANISFPWSKFYAQNFFISLPMMIIFGRFVSTREAEERDKQQAQSEARIAQTRLLQSQLHPHVLFNALNGLAELIRKDPPLAEQSVRSLSDLLRQLLEVSETGSITLAEERYMLENYLAIESMRLGDRLELSWNWDPAIDELRVMPLLLQPLVENAIKHGVSPHEAGGALHICGGWREEGLFLEVGNTGEHYEPSKGRKGIGLKNLKSRLKLAYGDEANLDIQEEGGWVRARILIKMAGLGVEHAIPQGGPS